MKRTLAVVLMLALLRAGAWALEKEMPGRDQDPTDQAIRYKKHTVGDKPEDWAKHLNDNDPAMRLEAVKLLGDTNDTKAVPFLMDAVESSDPRVSAIAVDSLGHFASPEAADLLAQKLVRPGTGLMFRRHVLVALGKIADPSTGPRVMDYLAATDDAETRATAIHALGEIGDVSTRDRLVAMGASERDPKMKELIDGAVARINERQIHPGTRPGRGGIEIFTHTEGPGMPPGDGVVR